MFSRPIFNYVSRIGNLVPFFFKCQTVEARAKLTGKYLSTSSAIKETFNVHSKYDFKTKIMADGSPPTIVDFSATWCMPCKLLTPRLDAAIAATEGKVNLALVDIDTLYDLSVDYEVTQVPTVLAVKDGKVVDKFIGSLLDEDELGAFVKKIM